MFDKDISNMAKPEIKGRGFMKVGNNFAEVQTFYTQPEKDWEYDTSLRETYGNPEFEKQCKLRKINIDDLNTGWVDQIIPEEKEPEEPDTDEDDDDDDGWGSDNRFDSPRGGGLGGRFDRNGGGSGGTRISLKKSEPPKPMGLVNPELSKLDEPPKKLESVSIDENDDEDEDDETESVDSSLDKLDEANSKDESSEDESSKDESSEVTMDKIAQLFEKSSEEKTESDETVEENKSSEGSESIITSKIEEPNNPTEMFVEVPKVPTTEAVNTENNIVHLEPGMPLVIKLPENLKKSDEFTIKLNM